LLILAVLGMNLATLASRKYFAMCVVALLAGVLAIGSVARGMFHNPKSSEPQIPAFIEAVERESQGDQVPFIVSFDHGVWDFVAAFVVEMDRRGKPVYLADESYTFLFTKRYTQLPEGLLSCHPRFLDFTVPGEASFRVIAQTEEVVVQEADLHYRLGSEFLLPKQERGSGLKGWAGEKWTGRRSELVMEVDPVYCDVKLTVVAEAFVPEQHPETCVNVIVNDQTVSQWKFQAGESVAPRNAVLPADLVNKQRPLHIVFESPDACSPAALGLSGDGRHLAMNVHQLWLSKIRED
jgi:hypothetical protein